MVASADQACWALVQAAAVAVLVLGCGDTTGSDEDDAVGSGDGASQACTLSHEGDLVVRTPAELEVLREHRLVSGDLIIDCPDCTTLTPLACLEEVGKMLSIVGCDQLESLDGLSGLRRVGLQNQSGGLAIGFYFEPWESSGNARLRTLEGLGPLERVEGRIDVRKNPALRDLSGLVGLKHIAASLLVEDNDALPSLRDLSELQSLRGALQIADNDALVDLAGLGSLVQATGLGINGNDALASLAGLDRFWGQSSDLALHVSDNPSLTDVTALKNVQGTIRDLFFIGNASLDTVTLNPGLAIVSGGLVVIDNAVLAAFFAPGLTHVAQGLQIEKNPRLAALDLGAPTRVGALYLGGNGSLRDTAALAEVRLVTGSCVIEGNEMLERVTLPELQEVGTEFRIGSNPLLTGFDLDGLRQAESIEVLYNERLPSCLVDDLLSSVVTSSLPWQCGNSLDACANPCPPRP